MKATALIALLACLSVTCNAALDFNASPAWKQAEKLHAEEQLNTVEPDRSLVKSIFEAVTSGRFEWVTTSYLPPVNCTQFPNGTVNSNPDVTAMFHIVVGDANKPVRPRTPGTDVFIPGGHLEHLAKYLPLLNHMNAVLEKYSDHIPTAFEVSLFDRTSPMDPLFATIDFANARFIVARDLLRYLPEDAPRYLTAAYSAVEEDIINEAKKGGRLDDKLPHMMKHTMEMMYDMMNADPVACFMCIVIYAPIITIIANIVMYKLGLQICEVCELSDSTCSALLLYLVRLVYENLPLLAAILFRICQDVCVVGMEMIMA